MSQAGEESSCSSDTELEMEKEQPVCAPAPTVYSRDEGSTDVTTSPAFQCLNELFSAGKITDTRVAELKGKYALLHKAVTSLQESEIQLFQEAKRLTVELEQQQYELEKAEQFPEESSTEVSQIRQQLLSCQNEYKAIKEREYEVQFKLECLQEEKKFLENECERIPKQKEADKKIKQLKENYDELCKEVIQRKAEINALKEDVLFQQNRLLIGKEEVEELLEKQANLKGELVRILAVTAHHRKETEKINQEKIDEEKKKEALSDQIEELNDTLKAIEKRTEEILQERQNVMEELNGKQILLESKERENNTLTKSLEIIRDKESAILLDREVLQENLNKCALEKKKQYYILTYQQAEKARELKELKKMELQLNVISDSLEQDKSQYKKLILEVEAILKSNGVLLERRQGLQREVEMAKRSLAEQEMLSDMDARMIEECIAEEGRLFKEQEKCRNELSRLAHLTSCKVEEKEQKCRDVLKTQIQLQNIIKKIKRKDLEIREYKRRTKEIQKEIQIFAKMYEVIQNERNKCVNLVRAAQQKASEIKNRVKSIENQIKSLRNTVLTKERKLQKQHLKNTNNVVIKNSLKNDYCKIVQIIHEMKSRKEQLRLDLERLTNMVTRIEEEIEQLCKKYEGVIQQKNESGLMLRNREEELCVLYKKVNMQEMLCRNGAIEMEAMNEKIRFLKLKVAEKKRQIKLAFKALPVKNALEAQLVVLQIQYSQCKDRIKEMETIFVDPTNETRKRGLGGKDLSPPELLEKIEQLEMELVQKEEKLLETDFLYEHVSQLTDRACATVEDGKRDKLLLAKRTNNLQKKIKDRTQKMMALVAELSMKKALVIKLQQEMRDKKQFLMTVSSRIDQGLPLPKEIENEWLKVLRNEKMQKEAAEARVKRAAEEEQAAVPGCGHMTAYTPGDEYGPPLLKACGTLAPFKPSESGSNMRHFRKPVVKSTEI
ncbi:coiled-coil domain-containing protein 146 [Phaenicophaeus curvirostris]|uniref:coiled-coil domain-containing protein 146 n=1 Tax=Phaenicophaeus curvirostris TaxID=33595 RepID=UPI0037F0D56B